MWLILGGLSVSLIGNYLLYQRYRISYAHVQKVQLDPLSIDQFSAESPFDADSSLTRILFFGDSRASAWPAPSALPNVQFANRGVGGHTSAQCLGRFAKHVEGSQADILIIQMGINDLKTIPLFPDQKSAIQETCLRNIQQQLRKSRQLGMKVVLSTIFPVGDIPTARRLVWSADVDQSVADINQQLIAWAASDPGIVILESSQLLAGPDGHVLPDYQRDFLHLNSQGYLRLNTALTELLSDSLLFVR